MKSVLGFFDTLLAFSSSSTMVEKDTPADGIMADAAPAAVQTPAASTASQYSKHIVVSGVGEVVLCTVWF